MLGNVLFGNLTKQCFTLTSVPYQHGDPICSRRAAGDHQLMLDILADGGSGLVSPVNLVEVSNHEDVEVDGHVEAISTCNSMYSVRRNLIIIISLK